MDDVVDLTDLSAQGIAPFPQLDDLFTHLRAVTRMRRPAVDLIPSLQLGVYLVTLSNQFFFRFSSSSRRAALLASHLVRASRAAVIFPSSLDFSASLRRLRCLLVFAWALL